MKRIFKNPCLIFLLLFFTSKNSPFFFPLSSSGKAALLPAERSRHRLCIGAGGASFPNRLPEALSQLWGCSTLCRNAFQKQTEKGKGKWRYTRDFCPACSLWPSREERQAEEKLKRLSTHAFLLSQNPLGISWCAEDISEFISSGSTNTMCLSEPDTHARLRDIGVAPLLDNSEQQAWVPTLLSRLSGLGKGEHRTSLRTSLAFEETN